MPTPSGETVSVDFNIGSNRYSAQMERDQVKGLVKSLKKIRSI
jgi:hypothetical protein